MNESKGLNPGFLDNSSALETFQEVFCVGKHCMGELCISGLSLLVELCHWSLWIVFRRRKLWAREPYKVELRMWIALNRWDLETMVCLILRSIKKRKSKTAQLNEWLLKRVLIITHLRTNKSSDKLKVFVEIGKLGGILSIHIEAEKGLERNRSLVSRKLKLHPRYVRP